MKSKRRDVKMFMMHSVSDIINCVPPLAVVGFSVCISVDAPLMTWFCSYGGSHCVIVLNAVVGNVSFVSKDFYDAVASMLCVMMILYLSVCLLGRQHDEDEIKRLRVLVWW